MDKGCKATISKRKTGISIKKVVYSVHFSDEAVARDNDTENLKTIEECYTIINKVIDNGCRMTEIIEER